LGPVISSNRAMLHAAAKSSSAIRGDAWHRNPEATTSAAGRRIPAAQPSGLRYRQSVVRLAVSANPIRATVDERQEAVATGR
jgi:hypothetical protein